ncbi:MAG TPA: hypothetical protein PK303_06330 [bacterium]|nr:hypothetical protein [bacterium]HOL35257.1 hypothetical protein [bacterium]HPP08716.1 hypothetical protein [bacterium]
MKKVLTTKRAIEEMSGEADLVCIIEQNNQTIHTRLIDNFINVKYESSHVIEKKLSNLAHKICDEIVHTISRKPGIAQSKIAYVSKVNNIPQIFLIDYDGENRIQVTDTPWEKDFPKFLSDNNLCFLSYFQNNPSIVMPNFETDRENQFLSYPGLNAFIDISAADSKIVFVSSKDGNPEIYLAFDGNIKRLTNFSGIDTHPCFSPDGNYIVFSSDRSGKPQVYIMNVNGAGLRRISYGFDYAVSPVWSPDGNFICFLARVGGLFQIVLYDVKNKTSVLLPVEGVWSESVSWAPDSRHIAFTRKQNFRSSVWILDVFTGEMRQLTKDNQDCYSPAWSR